MQIEIAFQVRCVECALAIGEISVYHGAQLLFRHTEYPLAELARQLADWAAIVNDSTNAACFCFIDPQERKWTGSFRIEPRPKDWQFTSMWERARHPHLPLDDFKLTVRRFIRGLKKSCAVIENAR